MNYRREAMTTTQEFAVIATGKNLDDNDFLNRLFEAKIGRAHV